MSWRKHIGQVVAGALATVLGSALLAVLRWDWVVAGFSWLTTNTEAPRWALLAGLLLLAMFATTTAVRWWRARSARAFGGRNWRSYTEDMFGGLYWTWEWADGDEPRVAELTPYCPTCRRRVIPFGDAAHCPGCYHPWPFRGVAPARMEFERKARAYARGEEG